MPCTLERTLIKFVCIWRKIGRKSGCKRDSERTFYSHVSVFFFPIMVKIYTLVNIDLFGRLTAE